MSVIIVLIAASLIVAALFLGGFVWAVKSGQYEDTRTPSMRMLSEEDHNAPKPKNLSNTRNDNQL